MSNAKLGCAVIASIVGGLLLVFLLAVAFGLMQLPLMNINRVVTQHSLQYVQTHQKVVLDYYADYLAAPDDAHKQSDVLQACAEANLLERSEWPDQAVGFLTVHCH